MSVTKQDVEYVAVLARLELKEEEKEGMIADMNSILQYIEKLKELDTEDVDIVVNPYYIENKFRSDEVTESMPLSEVLNNAPETLEEYILVPKVIEG
ncbi:MAG TPA: Asp-tRNA(Asn)/Glu-tRNA(Gln) amidotransferase subunit GatC [Clostridiaceae bacterium]